MAYGSAFLPMKDYCFSQNEQKRLKRLNTVKSAISSIAKHDNWTQKQVEKRAYEILQQKRMAEINQAKAAAKVGIKVLTGNKSTTQSELTRCGLRLRLPVEDINGAGVKGEDNRRQWTSSNRSYANDTTNKYEFSKQNKELPHGDVGESKVSELMQRQRIEALSIQDDLCVKEKTKQKTRKQKPSGYGEENIRDKKSDQVSIGLPLSQENVTGASAKKTDGSVAIFLGENLDRHNTKLEAPSNYSTSLVLPVESSLDDYSYDDDFSPQ